jgi:Ca-activated chloride channel family protein
MPNSRGLLASLAVASLGAALVAATAQQPQPGFTTTTRTVAVYATVTDANGRMVPDLTRDDFAIDDNGKRQALTTFANDPQPITVVVLLDRSGSMVPNYELEEKSAEAFVRSMAVEDKARIGSFSMHIQVDPPEFTHDQDALLKILQSQLQGEGPTPLWNAVDTGIDDLLLETGRRVVLVFTDGVDEPLNFSGRSKSLKDVMKRAEERDIIVYAIGLAGSSGMQSAARPIGGFGPGGFGGLGGRGMGGLRGGPPLEKPDEGLPKIANATGGSYFEISSPRDLPNTFARVADELHHQYVLGFTPAALDGKLHALTVRALKPQLTVHARRSYLATRER